MNEFNEQNSFNQSVSGKEKSNKGLIIVIVILTIAVLSLGGYICYDKIFNKPTNNNQEQNTNNNQQNQTPDKKTEPKANKVLYDTSSYGNDLYQIVELTDDGTVLVTINGTGERLNGEEKIIKKEVLKNVNKTFKVLAGQSDVCAGNTRLMFIMNDSSLSYLDIDQLECGDTIKIVNNVANLKDIVEVTEKIAPGACLDDGSYCEPDIHSVYAIDKNGTKVDITNKLQ